MAHLIPIKLKVEDFETSFEGKSLEVHRGGPLMDLCHGIVLPVRLQLQFWILDADLERLSFWCLEKWTLVEAHIPCLGGYAPSSAAPLICAGITDWHSDKCSPKHEF